MAIQRRSEAGEKSIRVGVLVAFGTALLVFVITYCAAWAELRQEMAQGDFGHGFVWIRLNIDFQIEEYNY